MRYRVPPPVVWIVVRIVDVVVGMGKVDGRQRGK
jgi:hypothetical protein